MGFSDNIASSLNNFNNLINNQIAQNNFNNNLVNQNKGANSTNFSNNQTIDPSLKTALTGLAGLLSTNNTSSINPINQNSYIVDKLIQGGADANKVNGLLSLLSASTDDIAYTRTGANDPNITLQNRNQVFGQDIQPFLSQASEIVRRGEDINKYLDTATNIVNKGDYDDFRRFISVTNTAIYATNNDSQELNKFFDFSQGVLDKRHYDLESNIFDVQTMIRYGATLDTSIKIMNQMEHTGLEGRNNMVDLNRVTIDAKNKGLYLPFLFQKMSESGDTRAFLNDYMAHNNMQTTAPDFNKFKRIERIDGEDMVIKQGESVALFAQAVSSVDGLLPQSSLYWSSLQSGAVSNGSSYLDLSKLAPGTY
ncbi:MAG: hypothetical protein H7263_00280, partial [Candidatus Sericytochromatia bacterium]|nr:hypothetical protein [Candidatus Sericytochromatia bacterium]